MFDIIPKSLSVKKRDLQSFDQIIFEKGESVLNNSVNASNLDLINNYKFNNVLEIGCGQKSFFKENIKDPKILWDGLETQLYTSVFENSLHTIIGYSENIPIENSHYDLVLANQSIEHWHEYNCTIENSLLEVNRVLKKNGIFSFNFPFFLHGHPKFVYGDLDWILGKIDANFWNIVDVIAYYDSKHGCYEGWKITGFPNYYVRKIHNTKSSIVISINLKKIKDQKSYNQNKDIKMKRNNSLKLNLQYGIKVAIYRGLRSILTGRIIGHFKKDYL